MTIDGNLHLHKHNDINVNLFHNTKIAINEKTKSMNNDYYIRVHHPNVLAEVGVAKWNPLAKLTPDVLATNIMGTKQHNELAFLAGVSTGYNVKEKMVPYVNALVGLSHKKATGYLEFTNARNMVTKEGETESHLATTRVVSVSVDSKLDKDLQVFGDASYNLDVKQGSSPVNYNLGLEYNLGNDTRIKSKFNNKSELMTALIHEYNKMANVSVNMIVTPKWASGTQAGYAAFKFAVQVELF
jgi:hypothetical protein